MGKQKVICTIGPSCDNIEILKKLKNAGVDIFRINMSHANIDDIYRFHKIALNLGLTLGIDTEGAQIRTKLKDKNNLFLTKNQTFDLNIISNNGESELNLYPREVLDQLKVGDKIRLDFNGAYVEVIHKENSTIKFLCNEPGEVGDNKGADSQRKIDLPDFTDKDIEALKVANKLNIKEIRLIRIRQARQESRIL